jgi:hypothetical protein
VRRVLLLDADCERLGGDLADLGVPRALIAADPAVYALQPLPLKDDLKLLAALSAYLPEAAAARAILAALAERDLAAWEAEFAPDPAGGAALTLRRAFWLTFLRQRAAAAVSDAALRQCAARLAAARVAPQAAGGVEVVLDGPLPWDGAAQLWQERRFRWLVQRLEAVMRYANLEARPPQTAVDVWCAELRGALTAAACWGVDLPAETAAWGRALSAA